MPATGTTATAPTGSAFDAFELAVGVADAIWVLAESMVDGLPRPVFAGSGALSAASAPVNGFATVQPRPEAQRDIDFYFSGAMTEHRQRILAALARQHVVVVNNQATPEYLRQDHVSRSQGLSVAAPVAGQPHSVGVAAALPPAEPQLRCCTRPTSCPRRSIRSCCAPPDDLIAWAEGALQLPDRREIADSSHQRFKAALPMTTLLPPLVDEALARLATPSTVRQAA